MPNAAIWSPRLLAILRIVAGLLFLEHGLMKLVGFPAPLNSLPGLAQPLFILAGLIELFGGALIAAGLFTRIAAFIASGEMAVAYFSFHLPHGFWPVLNHGDTAILFSLVFLYIVAAGPGAWSLDGRRGRKAVPGSDVGTTPSPSGLDQTA